MQAPVPQTMNPGAEALHRGQTPLGAQGKPRQFSLADGRVLYVEENFVDAKDAIKCGGLCSPLPTPPYVYAHHPRTGYPWDVCFTTAALECCCPLQTSNTSIERRTWYEDQDGCLMLKDGRQMCVSKRGWIRATKNADYYRYQRIPASAVGADGVIRLADGTQLYVNTRSSCAGVAKENKHTNTDPLRRQWRVSTAEVPERSDAREAMYCLAMLPFLVVVGACGCVEAFCQGGGDGETHTGSSSHDVAHKGAIE